MIAFEPPNPHPDPKAEPEPEPDPPLCRRQAEPEPEPDPGPPPHGVARGRTRTQTTSGPPGVLTAKHIKSCNMLVRPKVPKVSKIPDHGTGAASRYRV